MMDWCALSRKCQVGLEVDCISGFLKYDIPCGGPSFLKRPKRSIKTCPSGGPTFHSLLGACAAEPLLLRTRPDNAFLSIIFVTYEQLCASNDRENALAMARSRYADFYRADS